MSRRVILRSVPEASKPTRSEGPIDHPAFALLGPVVSMTARIRDAIERIDNGALYATDDLVVLLRAVLSPTRGNNVLMRLCSAVQASVPTVRLSKPPPGSADVVFAVGSLPIDVAASEADGAEVVPFSRWQSRRVLSIRSDGQQQNYTWEHFVRDYAHTWGGVHLDGTVSRHLTSLDRHFVADLPLAAYLFRSAGVAIWTAAQELLYGALRASLADMLRKEGSNVDLSAPPRTPPSIAAPGAPDGPPRDISDRGMLQYFCHSEEGVELLWYVDGESDHNMLSLYFGSVPYTIRYIPPDSIQFDRKQTLTTPVQRIYIPPRDEARPVYPTSTRGFVRDLRRLRAEA